VFKIPNLNSATFPDQSSPDSRDFDIITSGLSGTGVLSGCAVTAQSTPDMTVQVGSGSITLAGTQSNVSGGTVSISAADPSNSRFDMIVASVSGAVSAVTGTPGSGSGLVFPDPGVNVVLATVYVPAGITSIQTVQITDKRVLLAAPYFHANETNGSNLMLARIDPQDTSIGPATWTVGDNIFGAQRDFFWQMGYNNSGQGGRVLSSEPSFTWSIESNNQNSLIAYWEFFDSTGSFSFRPFTVTIDRTASSIDLASKTIMLGCPIIQFVRPSDQSKFAQFSPSAIDFYNPSATASTTTLRLNTQVSGSVSQMKFQVDVATTSLQMTSWAYYQTEFQQNGRNLLYLQNDNVGDWGVNVGNDTSIVASLLVDAIGNNTTFPTAIVKGRASQTGSQLEIHDSSDVILSRFDTNGYFMTRKTSIPADAALATGELALWFDSTAGAAKLMVKAKNASGTVVTGSLALA
jgi:hypothetical protein